MYLWLLFSIRLIRPSPKYCINVDDVFVNTLTKHNIHVIFKACLFYHDLRNFAMWIRLTFDLLYFTAAGSPLLHWSISMWQAYWHVTLLWLYCWVGVDWQTIYYSTLVILLGRLVEFVTIFTLIFIANLDLLRKYIRSAYFEIKQFAVIKNGST